MADRFKRSNLTTMLNHLLLRCTPLLNCESKLLLDNSPLVTDHR